MEKTPNHEEAIASFSRELASAIGSVITEALDLPIAFTVKDASDLPERNDEAVQFRIRANGVEGVECFIEMYTNGVISLGSKLLGEDASGFREQYAEAVHHVIATAVARLSSNKRAVFTVERASGLVLKGLLAVPLAGTGLACDLPVLLYFSSRFQDAFSGNSQSTLGSAQDFDPRNLNLVMDVELNVSLRFGQREMALREVLELESGSVVELNRRVDEPVELLLDGRVIATGEAVIVDGNYGLRVTKVSPLIAPQLY